MKKLIVNACILFGVFMSVSIYAQGRDMIYTYWHQLDGPHWVLKPASISIADDHIYTFGSDNNDIDNIIVSDDGGIQWRRDPYDDVPANCISVSSINPIHAYYTSPENNVFSTFNSGLQWNGPTNTPPENLNFSCCAANPLNYSKALAGCLSSQSSSNNLWKTENHGAEWSAISNVPDR